MSPQSYTVTPQEVAALSAYTQDDVLTYQHRAIQLFAKADEYERIGLYHMGRDLRDCARAFRDMAAQMERRMR